MARRSMMDLINRNVDKANAKSPSTPVNNTDLRSTFKKDEQTTPAQPQAKGLLQQLREDAALRPQLEARIAELEDALEDAQDTGEELASLRIRFDHAQRVADEASSRVKENDERIIKLNAVIQYSLGVLTVCAKGLDIEDAVTTIKTMVAGVNGAQH